MTVCDVVVVGGGPAGSSLAWALTRRDLDVVVLDRKTFPRDKVCAGWITPAVARSLELELEDYARGRVLQPIHGFRVGVLGGRQTETRFAGDPMSYGIRRCELDDYLLRRSGAELRLGQALNELRRDDGGWEVNGEIRARMLVGAGGHLCPVARHLGARPGRRESAIVAQEVEFEMTPEQRTVCATDATLPELFFCRDLRGYGWVFRKGDHLNLGLGRDDAEGLTSHVDAFRRWLVAEGRIPADTPRRFDGHAYRLYSHPPRRLLQDGVLLVGDAAGMAEPHSGEGIRPAIESALLAAEVILGAGGDYREQRLAVYGERLAGRFGPRGASSRRGEAAPGRVRQALARRLLATKWFTRRVVLERWFLQLHRPSLIPAFLHGPDGSADRRDPIPERGRFARQ